MTRVFVSHATPDSAFAEQLASDLRAFGIDAWLDSSHMGPGDFVARISAALQRDVLVLVLTRAAIASPWVQQEVNAAITRANQRLMLPPIIIQAERLQPNEIPGLWTVYHRYDATGDYMVALASAVKELGGAGGAPLAPLAGTVNVAGAAPATGQSMPPYAPRPAYAPQPSSALQPAYAPQPTFMPQPASAVPAAKPARWTPSYPWIAYATIGGIVLGGLILLASGVSTNWDGNRMGVAIAISVLLAGLGFLAGLAGMIGNLVAHKAWGWWAAALVTGPVLYTLSRLNVFGTSYSTYLAWSIIGGVCLVLTVAAFGLYGPRPRHS